LNGIGGSRLKGGEDHAAPRYVYVYLHEIVKYIYRKEDNPILDYLTDEDKKFIEPIYYYPIIPMCLINE